MVRSTVFAFAIAILLTPRADALITGGTGNAPINDPGWQKGAAAVFNVTSRVAYWEGPPFGGGQWHGECRGDAAALSKVLVDFARIDSKIKRVIVHDGKGQSFWLNMNREAAKRAAAEIDWAVTIWQPASWERLRNLPRDLNPTGLGQDADGPPAQIDIYTGGNVRWADIKMPAGVEVVDDRLEAHGFALTDGAVVEGVLTDAANQLPMAGKVRLQRVETAKGGYQYTTVAELNADDKGRWVVKNAPAGWHRFVAEADGFVPRVLGYATFDDQPGWRKLPGKLSRPAAVAGRVTDESGQPLALVAVQLADVSAGDDRYESPAGYEVKTDADGRFRIAAPIGSCRIWLVKSGYVRPGLGLDIKTPKDDIALTMAKSARVVVTVEFGNDPRPAGYVVHIVPEGGEAVGKWSGSGNIDAMNQITFKEIPPGKYVLYGNPNPSSGNRKSKELTVDLKGGETKDVKLPHQ